MIVQFPRAYQRDHFDCSGKIGPLFPSQTKPEWPMYSYDRGGWLLWSAIARELHSAGWSERKIRDWLQSKAPRIALDCDLGEKIDTAAKDYVREQLLG